MIAFVPREKISKNWIFVAPILSIVFTIFFGLLIFTFLGYNPIETLYQIFVSPFSRIDRISDILVKACPLIIIGTGLMLCFKSNVTVFLHYSNHVPVILLLYRFFASNNSLSGSAT